MNERRVLVVGSSLFAETLAQMLVNAKAVTVVGTAPTPDAALPLLQAECPDAVILVVVTDETDPTDFSQFLVEQPDLPIIRADINANTVQVITSRQVSARASDLLAVIAELPKHEYLPPSETDPGIE